MTVTAEYLSAQKRLRDEAVTLSNTGEQVPPVPEKAEEPRTAQQESILLDEGDWPRAAHKFMKTVLPNVRHQNDDFMIWDEGAYRVLERAYVKSEARRWLMNARKRSFAKGKEKIGPFRPNTNDCNELLSAVADLSNVPLDFQPTCYLPGHGKGMPAPSDLVCFPNVILDLKLRNIFEATPALFNMSAVAFPFQTEAPPPVNWLKFLHQIFTGEQDQIDALQEMFGYCLSQDVSFEKAFMILGPKRSGKDTLRRVLESLLPKRNVCGPTLDSMSTTFGMSALVNMQLAVVGDMRHGKNTDYGVLAENILKLTGRSLFTFDRKYKDHWTGYLFCKLLIISNDRARFRDSSGALASRFITFRTRQSFYGREDRNLFEEKLRPELPGVLLWALEGLQRVRANGRLAEPDCSLQEQKQLSRDGAPVLAFVDDMLVLDPGASIAKDALHKMWSDYATANDL